MPDEQRSMGENEPVERDEDRSSRSKDDVLDYRAPSAAKPSGGLFSIYKSGQGYWVRMCTAGAVALVAAILAMFLYTQLQVWLPDSWLPARRSGVASGIVGGFLLALAVIAFRVLNKPTVVDFLIATESEMRKVNWTSKKDLMGATKVVILFMFMIAAILFAVDVGFGYFFYFIKVLQNKPL